MPLSIQIWWCMPVILEVGARGREVQGQPGFRGKFLSRTKQIPRRKRIRVMDVSVSLCSRWSPSGSGGAMVLNLISHRKNQPCKGKKDAVRREVCRTKDIRELRVDAGGTERLECEVCGERGGVL